MKNKEKNDLEEMLNESVKNLQESKGYIDILRKQNKNQEISNEMYLLFILFCRDGCYSIQRNFKKHKSKCFKMLLKCCN